MKDRKPRNQFWSGSRRVRVGDKTGTRLDTTSVGSRVRWWVWSSGVSPADDFRRGSSVLSTTWDLTGHAGPTGHECRVGRPSVPGSFLRNVSYGPWRKTVQSRQKSGPRYRGGDMTGYIVRSFGKRRWGGVFVHRGTSRVSCRKSGFYGGRPLSSPEPGVYSVGGFGNWGPVTTSLRSSFHLFV